MKGKSLPVLDPWWRVEPLADGVSRLFEPAVHPLLQGNVFFVRGERRDLVIDAGTGIASLRDALQQSGLLEPERPLLAVATHAHYDHVGCLHEFEQRLIHPDEAEELTDPTEEPTLFTSRSDPDFIAVVRRAGMELPELLIDALPRPDFDPDAYDFPKVAATGTLVEGDRVELGDRTLDVLHLPGHSAGSIGLFERQTGVLFAGDLIYDDVLIAEGPGTDLAAYVASMRRVRGLEVSVVHGGHEPSFGRERMLEIIDEFLAAHAAAAG
jgi:glyoxylase-like metal-dependent hydrolase (beta-lactamase superfamily II)